jgi:hypothetical protein
MKTIRSVAGETLGKVSKDVFAGYCAWAPYRGGWHKVAESKRTIALARQALRDWHSLRPDQQAYKAEKL